MLVPFPSTVLPFGAASGSANASDGSLTYDGGILRVAPDRVMIYMTMTGVMDPVAGATPTSITWPLPAPFPNTSGGILGAGMRSSVTVTGTGASEGIMVTTIASGTPTSLTIFHDGTGLGTAPVEASFTLVFDAAIV